MHIQPLKIRVHVQTQSLVLVSPPHAFANEERICVRGIVNFEGGLSGEHVTLRFDHALLFNIGACCWSGPCKAGSKQSSLQHRPRSSPLQSQRARQHRGYLKTQQQQRPPQPGIHDKIGDQSSANHNVSLFQRCLVKILTRGDVTHAVAKASGLSRRLCMFDSDALVWVYSCCNLW